MRVIKHYEIDNKNIFFYSNIYSDINLIDNARVRDIASKWNNIRENVDRSRGQKLQAIDDYVNNLEKRINEVTNDPLAKKIKKVIGEIQEDIAKEQLELEQLEERQIKAISSIDDSCKQIVDELRNVWIQIYSANSFFGKKTISKITRVKELGWKNSTHKLTIDSIHLIIQ